MALASQDHSRRSNGHKSKPVGRAGVFDFSEKRIGTLGLI